MKLQNKFHLNALQKITAYTSNQSLAMSEFFSGKEIAMIGSAGTGKTFLALYLGLSLVASGECDNITIVRSAVAVRDLGFLPGDAKEKTEIFEMPYAAICNELLPYKETYKGLKAGGYVYFMTTSFIRGLTLRNTCVIVDECQSLNAHELDSIITRLGPGCRLILCGDGIQTDLRFFNERKGFHDIMAIMGAIPNFSIIEFGVEDIVRSGFVRDYIIARESYGLVC